MYRLQWPDINFRRKILTVNKSKNNERRHIPLNSTALANLEFLRARALDNRSDYVFVGKKGERLISNRHWFTAAVKKAGLQDFTWYCLRHTFASRLAMAGVDLLKIKELMGHKSIQMTCRYAHLAPSALAEAVEKLVPQPTATTGAISSESQLASGSGKVQ